MKVAKSLVLGGRLINADEVTNRYTAYKDLLLVCPECYKTVYWKEATGFSSGRHFAHSARTTHGEECSQRVNIQGDSYLESNADDKGQRLEIFQEHLLSIIINTFGSRPKSKISEFQNKFKDKSSDLSKYIYNLFLGQFCLHEFERLPRVEDNPKIALEVILYLRQNHSVLREVIELGIDWFSAGTDCLRFQEVSGRTIISTHLNIIILRYILYIIDSTFGHRKSIDPLIIQKYELTVANSTEQDIKKYESEARQQRWLILHKHFWDMLLTSKAFKHPDIYEIAQYAREGAIPNEEFHRLLKLSDNDLMETLRVSGLRPTVLWAAHDQAFDQMQSIHNREIWIPSFVDEVASNLESFKDITFDSQESHDEHKEYFAGWDKKYHTTTTKEIVDFLCSSQSKYLFREVLYFLMAGIIGESPHLLDSPLKNLKYQAMYKLIEVLLMIDWRFEFVKASQGSV